MIVRKIRPEEFKRVRQLCALGFEYAMKDAKLPPEAVLDRVRTNPRSIQDLHWDSQWAAFEDDDSTMMGTMTVIPWTGRFDGHDVPMGGIGGVVTLPPYRRSGAIRGCFQAALREMYDGGTPLSYLYPFSTAFYRKFGYEVACDWVRWRLKLEGMPSAETGGSWRLSEADRPLEADIRAVDAVRQARYNCMVVARATEYLFLSEDSFVMKRYTYVYYDAGGRPSAYLTCVPVHGELDCPRFVFNDREGLLGLLGLLRRMSADHSHATVYLPDDADLRGVLPEWSFGCVERSVEQRGMVRAVNAEALLRMARMRGEGRLRIAIRDEMLPENSDCFEVRFVPGIPNEVFRTDAVPDVELTIQDFGRLIVGCCESADPMWLPDVKLLCPPDAAAKVFYRKPAFISQYF